MLLYTFSHLHRIPSFLLNQYDQLQIYYAPVIYSKYEDPVDQKLLMKVLG